MLEEYDDKGYTAFMVNICETSSGVHYDIDLHELLFTLSTARPDKVIIAIPGGHANALSLIHI